MTVNEKEYLGDGVYAEDAMHGIVLTTHDGFRETNRIVLEPVVLEALTAFSLRRATR